MKSLFVPLIVAAGMLSVGVAQANPELAKAQCGKCHAVDKEKMGPSFNDIAKKFKGKDEPAILAAYKANKDHADNKAKPEQVKTISNWILTLK